MVMFVNSISLNKSLFRLLFAKVILGIFDVYLVDCVNGNRRSLKISKFGGI